MHAITFTSDVSIFRPAGGHSYVAGEGGVAYVRPVDLPAPRCADAANPTLVKNLCGRFTTYMHGCRSHGPVSGRPRTSYFGRHSVMHHLHGSLSIHRGVAYFKGCSGFSGIRALAEDLFLETPRCVVHMGVFKTYLGRHLQTLQGGYLEQCVPRRFKCVRVRQRMIDGSQSVKLHIERFDESELPFLTDSLVPTSADLSVTHTGVLLLRFSWSRCFWSEETEATVLRFCSWMAEELRQCC